MPHTIRKNAREWQRLWRGGNIITETHGDDPGMPRRSPRKRTDLARSLGLRGRKSTARKKPRPITGTGPAAVAGPFFWRRWRRCPPSDPNLSKGSISMMILFMDRSEG